MKLRIGIFWTLYYLASRAEDLHKKANLHGDPVKAEIEYVYSSVLQH